MELLYTFVHPIKTETNKIHHYLENEDEEHEEVHILVSDRHVRHVDDLQGR